MYLSFITMFRSPKQRDSLKNAISDVSSVTGRNKLRVCGDIILSGFIHGSTAQEYENLKFYERTCENRATFITSYYNLGNYKKLNSRPDREIFRDKVKFNKIFEDYINREWILIDKDSPDEFADFMKKHKSVIIKPRYGDSGKNIVFFDSSEKVDDSIFEIIEKYSGNIAEEIVINHDEIKKLNPTSLNTIRIITIITKEAVEFLYAGIRIGAPDSRVDNLSQGGKVASINLETGEIEDVFQSKTTSGITFCADNYIGKKIPYWDELKEFVRNAAAEVATVRYVAWDVAVTPYGPILIEGNHSSGNTIIQAGIDVSAPGLRPKLEGIMKKC